MCRYAFSQYRDKYVCFSCRTSFKGFHPDRDEVGAATCGRCGQPGTFIGKDMRPPKASASGRAWRLFRKQVEVAQLHTCGCDGPGDLPSALWQTSSFDWRKPYKPSSSK